MNSTQFFFDYFIISGISDVAELQFPIFLLVLLIYLLTVTGNAIIVQLVYLDHYLHTPMYFFLANLSLVDISSSTVTSFKILTSFITGNSKVPYHACIIQMYFWSSLIVLECLILAAMSYDRYVAICNPLKYHMVMKSTICALMASLCWFWGFLETLPHTIIVFSFSCYRSNRINHFFCDILPLKNLTCSKITLLNNVIFASTLFHLFFSFPLTFIPYIFIIITIVRIPSSAGRRKAFHTCSSHVTVVILLYVVLFCQYINPQQESSLDTSKLFSLFNTLAVPALNPLIYSLKNKDVKSALRRQLNNIGVFFKSIL
ncbi:olfactory receptor 8D1-like [Gastrophryne carolinensis]